MTNEEKKQGECCPDCFHKARYAGDAGMADVCGDTGCACHRPLGVNVGDSATPRDKFGSL